jgi:hypothetical protein
MHDLHLPSSAQPSSMISPVLQSWTAQTAMDLPGFAGRGHAVASSASDAQPRSLRTRGSRASEQPECQELVMASPHWRLGCLTPSE